MYSNNNNNNNNNKPSKKQKKQVHNKPSVLTLYIQVHGHVS